jgi:hypothetical protein
MKQAQTWGERQGGPEFDGLWAGVIAAMVAWGGMIAWLWMRGHAGSGFSVFYNLPISVLFIGLLAHEGWMCRTQGARVYLKRHAPVVIVWVLGFVVLYLRLIAKSVDVSGHMTWALIMAAQCYAYRLPGWFCALVAGVCLQVLGLKVFWLGGVSVYWGLLAGGVLGAGMILGVRMGRGHGKNSEQIFYHEDSKTRREEPDKEEG